MYVCVGGRWEGGGTCGRGGGLRWGGVSRWPSGEALLG